MSEWHISYYREAELLITRMIISWKEKLNLLENGAFPCFACGTPNLAQNKHQKQKIPPSPNLEIRGEMGGRVLDKQKKELCPEIINRKTSNIE